MSYRAEVYCYEGKKSRYQQWHDKLDAQTAARIAAHVRRLEFGNFGSVKNIKNGVRESAIDTGPGYRIYFGAMVKSGVQAVESSGGLIDSLHFNSVVEFDSGDDLGQVVKASEFAPALLSTQSQFEHHVQHRVT